MRIPLLARRGNLKERSEAGLQTECQTVFRTAAGVTYRSRAMGREIRGVTPNPVSDLFQEQPDYDWISIFGKLKERQMGMKLLVSWGMASFLSFQWCSLLTVCGVASVVEL